jgi:hypothetical protein
MGPLSCHENGFKMIPQPDNVLLVLDAASYFLSLLLLAVFGVMLLCYTIAATMAHASKQQDDMEQLALKFCHKK